MRYDDMQVDGWVVQQRFDENVGGRSELLMPTLALPGSRERERERRALNPGTQTRGNHEWCDFKFEMSKRSNP